MFAWRGFWWKESHPRSTSMLGIGDSEEEKPILPRGKMRFQETYFWILQHRLELAKHRVGIQKVGYLQFAFGRCHTEDFELWILSPGSWVTRDSVAGADAALTSQVTVSLPSMLHGTLHCQHIWMLDLKQYRSVSNLRPEETGSVHLRQIILAAGWSQNYERERQRIRNWPRGLKRNEVWGKL